MSDDPMPEPADFTWPGGEINRQGFRKAKREWRERNGGGGGRARRFAQGAVVAGQLAASVYGADASLASSALDDPSDAVGSMSDIVETSQNSERNRRSKDMDQGTKDKGNKTGGSSSWF